MVYHLREIVASTTVILAPCPCGQRVRKRSQVPISGESGESGGQFREATPHEDVAVFSGKGISIFHDFQRETQGGGPGSPGRPKEAQGAPKG